MLIRELTRPECLELLTRARLGRLACASQNQPYIVPFFFAFDEHYLYSFSTVGQKIEWMRNNPNVCVEVDEVVSAQQWASVVVYGQYEEMPNSPEWRGVREDVRKRLMERNAIWWEPGYAKTILHDRERSLTPFFYRIRVVQITGHRAAANGTPAGTKPSMTAPIGNRWLQKVLGSVRKKP